MLASDPLPQGLRAALDLYLASGDDSLLSSFRATLLPKAPDGALLRGIRLVLTDVDGVLTDGGMIYGEDGGEGKRFNTRDGMGFEIVRSLGLKTGIVTSEDTRIVARRAAKLRVDVLHQGVRQKDASLREICDALGIAPSEVAYIGDDVNDLSILKKVGFAACPADAVEAVKRCVHYVCRKRGGEGAVRELCDLIADAHGVP